jgi:hypothetical protein
MDAIWWTTPPDQGLEHQEGLEHAKDPPHQELRRHEEGLVKAASKGAAPLELQVV